MSVSLNDQSHTNGPCNSSEILSLSDPVTLSGPRLKDGTHIIRDNGDSPPFCGVCLRLLTLLVTTLLSPLIKTQFSYDGLASVKKEFHIKYLPQTPGCLIKYELKPVCFFLIVDLIDSKNQIDWSN